MEAQEMQKSSLRGHGIYWYGGISYEERRSKGRGIALLPIGVFLVIFLGSGIVFGDFNAMPAVVGFLIALFVAFLQNRQLSFADKIKVVSAGVGEENIITMSLIFLCARRVFSVR